MTCLTSTPLNLAKKFKCPNCNTLVEDTKKTRITYKLIILHEEISRTITQDIHIPFLLQKLLPDLSIENYSKYKSNSDFLSSSALVCDNCFLMLTEEKKSFIQKTVIK